MLEKEKVVLNKVQSLSDDLDKELIMYVQTLLSETETYMDATKIVNSLKANSSDVQVHRIAEKMHAIIMTIALNKKTSVRKEV